MSDELKPTEDTGATDSGDAQPGAYGPHERTAYPAQGGVYTRWIGPFPHTVTVSGPGPDAAYWQAQAATAIRAAEASAAEVDRLCGQLAQTQAERDAALAQLASVRAQLARVSSTLADERRARAVQRGR